MSLELRHAESQQYADVRLLYTLSVYWELHAQVASELNRLGGSIGLILNRSSRKKALPLPPVHAVVSIFDLRQQRVRRHYWPTPHLLRIKSHHGSTRVTGLNILFIPHPKIRQQLGVLQSLYRLVTLSCTLPYPDCLCFAAGYGDQVLFTGIHVVLFFPQGARYLRRTRGQSFSSLSLFTR